MGQPDIDLPIARVAVDTSLPHLDRLFDYRVTDAQDAYAVEGCRVKVRIAGKQTNGYLIDRVHDSEHSVAPLSRVVSGESVLRPDVLSAASAVAQRYAGTLSDVLRLAIPHRHARTEGETGVSAGIPPCVADPADPVRELAEAVTTDNPVRTCWAATPRDHVYRQMAALSAATVRGGRGVIVCVPDRNDVERCAAAFASVLGNDQYHAIVTSNQNPAERYRAFLRLSRGHCRIAIGTRTAAFAPVHRLALVMMWDDGDDLFLEPRAPYPHAREVLLTRALQSSASALLAGYARSTEAQQLTDAGWCRDISPSLSQRRSTWPKLAVSDGTEAGTSPVRLPHALYSAIRVAQGPVLVQVPRRGYRVVLACDACRSRAYCGECGGPLIQSSGKSAPQCSWCGIEYASWRCAQCGGAALRAPVLGNQRTAEEFAQAFRDRTVLTAHAGSPIAQVTTSDALVLATPGAEPRAEGGYALVVLLDTWLSLGRDELRTVEEAHRRWFNALALARPGERAFAVGDPYALQALVRADPVGLAARELAIRREVHLPPAARLASVQGPGDALAALVNRRWTQHAEVLGPVPAGTTSDGPDEPNQRLVIRAPRSEGSALADELKAVASERSKTKQPPLRIEVDPQTI